MSRLVASLDDQRQAIGICFPNANGVASSERRIPDVEREPAPHGRDGGVRLLVHGRRLDGADPVVVHVGVEGEAVRFLRPHHVHALVLPVGVALHVELGREVVVDGHDARWGPIAVGRCEEGQHSRGSNHEEQEISQRGNHDAVIRLQYSSASRPADWIKQTLTISDRRRICKKKVRYKNEDHCAIDRQQKQ